jgi:hypothetical protein
MFLLCRGVCDVHVILVGYHVIQDSVLDSPLLVYLFYPGYLNYYCIQTNTPKSTS